MVDERETYYEQLVFNESVCDGLSVHLSGDGMVLIGGVDFDDTAYVALADVPALRDCLDRLLAAAKIASGTPAAEAEP